MSCSFGVEERPAGDALKFGAFGLALGFGSLGPRAALCSARGFVRSPLWGLGRGVVEGAKSWSFSLHS